MAPSTRRAAHACSRREEGQPASFRSIEDGGAKGPTTGIGSSSPRGQSRGAQADAVAYGQLPDPFATGAWFCRAASSEVCGSSWMTRTCVPSGAGRWRSAAPGSGQGQGQGNGAEAGPRAPQGRQGQERQDQPGRRQCPPQRKSAPKRSGSAEQTYTSASAQSTKAKKAGWCRPPARPHADRVGLHRRRRVPARPAGGGGGHRGRAVAAAAAAGRRRQARRGRGR